jgi:hypothetical protein
MKNIILFILTSIAFTACSNDYTDLAPVSDRNEANFYNSSEDFIFGINASYRGLQSNEVYGRSYWTMFEMRADNTDQGPDQTGLANQFTVINTFTEDALNQQIDAAWKGSYRIISNSNAILDRIDAVEMEDSLKKRIIGEALFLRSLMYYHLAIAYGNIPLQLTVFIPGEKLTQVDQTTVYMQLIEDLKKAEENLIQDYGISDVGRATKGAAATLLAKVYLTVGQNSDAEVVLKRIVSNYNYSLLPDYASLWGSMNENNDESIFEVQFLSGGIGQGSSFTNDFSPNAFLQNGQGYGRNRPTDGMVNAYETGDTRFGASLGVSYVNENDEVITANYIKKYSDNPPAENDSDINFVVFRYADVLLMLAEALGESTESYGYINQIRSRAGLAPISALSAGTFAEKLLRERRVELAFENHRWADLKRFNVSKQKINNAEPFIPESAVKDLFFIPQREMDINSNFTQNN